MSNGLLGEFRVGEDVAIALDATGGDPVTVIAITARMKSALVANNRLVLDDSAPAIVLSIAAQVPAAAGWTISLPGAQSASLTPGLYGIDARLVIAGGVAMTEQTAFVSLTRAAVA